MLSKSLPKYERGTSCKLALAKAIIITPKSSITAHAAKNTFSEVGTLLLDNDNIPKAKTMSVAIGISAPDCVAVPKLHCKNIPAGTNIPTKAPKIDNRVPLNFES